MGRKKILIVEDDENAATFYRQALEEARFDTHVCATGAHALRLFNEFMPDLVLLDLALADDVDGFAVLASLRDRSDVAVIILTGQPGDAKEVRGLTLGADNYLTKPVSRAALVARVRAQLRLHRGPVAAAGVHRYGDLVIDLDHGQATRGEGRFTFGEVERRVLGRLLHTPGEPVSRRELLHIGWGFTLPMITPEDLRVLENTVYRLRQKLAHRGRQPGLIRNVFEVGFSIRPPDAVEHAAADG